MTIETETFNFERPESASPGMPLKRPPKRIVPWTKPLPSLPEPIKKPNPAPIREQPPVREPVPTHALTK